MHLLRSLLLILVAAAVLVPAGTAAASPPGNDERVNPVTLNGATAGTTVGATHTYPHEGGRPGTGTHSVWYRWTAASTGRVTITVSAASFDSVVAAYPAWYSPSDSEFAVDADTGGGDTTSSISFDTKAGQEWEIAVDSYVKNQTGAFTITPSFTANPPAPANDDFADAQTIDPGFIRQSHRYATAEAGEPEHRITGTPAKSVWFKWTPLVSGYARLSGFCGTADLHDTKAVVAVYTGATLGALNEVTYTQTPVTDACTASNVVFHAIAGTTYRIVLDNASADTGQGVLSFEFDSVAPTTTFKGTKTAFGPNQSIEWQADEYGTTFKCRLDGGNIVNCSTGYAMTNVPAGPHTLEVRGTDELGNQEVWRSKSFTVDRTPPQTTIDSGPTAVAYAKGTTFTFSSDEAGATFACKYFANQALQPCTSPYVVPDHLPEGQQSVIVVATDAQGNVDPTPATWTYTVDHRLAYVPPVPKGDGSSYTPPAPAAPLPTPVAASTPAATSTAGREVVGVGVQTRISRRKLAKPGLKVAVRCPFGCRAVVRLINARGKTVARTTARGGTTATLKVRKRLPLGTYRVTVTGPDGKSAALNVRLTAR